MKIIPSILKVILVVLLFLSGVVLAERTYLNENIIGIEVLGQSGTECDWIYDQIYTAITNGNYNDYLADSVIEYRFHNASVYNGIPIPAGVYKTVCAESDSGEAVVSSLPVPSAALRNRSFHFEFSESKFLQQAYLFIMSTLGNAEKFLLNLFYGI